jgi:hypothetical protein
MPSVSVTNEMPIAVPIPETEMINQIDSLNGLLREILKVILKVS